MMKAIALKPRCMFFTGKHCCKTCYNAACKKQSGTSNEAPSSPVECGSMLQMAIYFPEQQHSRYGVLRAVVKDTTNENNSSTRGEMVFLDSDDRVADNSADPQLSQGNPMTDGKWHMVTVTTQPDLSTGFLLYFDGDAVGEMKRGRYTGKEANITQLQQVIYLQCLLSRLDLGQNTDTCNSVAMCFSLCLG